MYTGESAKHLNKTGTEIYVGLGVAISGLGAKVVTRIQIPRAPTVSETCWSAKGRRDAKMSLQTRRTSRLVRRPRDHRHSVRATTTPKLSRTSRSTTIDPGLHRSYPGILATTRTHRLTSAQGLQMRPRAHSVQLLLLRGSALQTTPEGLDGQFLGSGMGRS